MEKTPDRRLARTELRAEVERAVRVAGRPVGYRREQNRDPDRIDHFFISLRARPVGLVEIALNTYSRRNFRRGFDPRVRLAVVPSTWNVLPAEGIFTSAGFDYKPIEIENHVVYREYERPELEELFIEKTRTALFAEGWGDLYLRSHPGIHQVHSRRKNAIVPMDDLQRDGALKFYFQNDAASELVLLKFFGQD